MKRDKEMTMKKKNNNYIVKDVLRVIETNFYSQDVDLAGCRLELYTLQNEFQDPLELKDAIIEVVIDYFYRHPLIINKVKKLLQNQ